MIMTQYTHRLPADYDLQGIRARASERRAVWAEEPHLYFKAFLLRERGHLGASANSYTSLYLWRDDAAVRDWIAGRFDYVTAAFGRPPVHSCSALAAFRGPAEAARYAVIEDVEIPVDANLAETFSAEIARLGEAARASAAVAAAVGVDTGRWRLKRVVLSEGEPSPSSAGERYEAIEIATPLLDTLPRA